MTSDDVIRMAREAEVPVRGHYDEQGLTPQELERFAALVAAYEREACKDLWEAQRLTDCQISDHVEAAVAAEREACAKVVEASPSYDWHRFACETAAAIRARNNNAP